MTTAVAAPVKERPILFSGPMVQAIQAGHKTMTRRVVKASPGEQAEWLTPDRVLRVPTMEPCLIDGEQWAQMEHPMGGPGGCVRCPYGRPGDRLWVRESWWEAYDGLDGTYLCGYVADGGRPHVTACRDAINSPTVAKKPSIHMSRVQSRLLLEVVSVRVERLQAISESDAIAEGLKCLSKDGGITWKYGIPEADGWPGPTGWQWREWESDPIAAYRKLWDSINAGRGHGWETNPWVWVVEFRRISAS